MSDYSCGACGSTGLVIKAKQGEWNLSCSNGHRIVPTPGLVLVITV